MAKNRLTLLLAGVAAIGLPALSAQAYVAETPQFILRAGSAAALTDGDARLGPVDAAIRAQLAHAGRDGSYHQKRDGAGVAAFYADRNFAPVWTADGHLTEAALKVIDRLQHADEDGLDATAFATPAATPGTADPERLAQAEVMLSMAVARYARQAYAGRLDPSTVSGYIDIKPHLPDPIEALATITGADDPAAAMAAFNPQQPGYLALRDQLAKLRATAAAEEHQVVVPDGKALKLGVTDERVPILRARLEVATPSADPETFDEALDAAVRAYQSAEGLAADGIVGKNTISSLNGPKVNAEAEIIANMERWRWMPRDLGHFYVQVNIPEYTLRIMKDGEVFHRTRVVVGKVSSQTPIFNDEIEHVVVNPYWNVPASIVRSELLPALMSNPGSVGGYEVYARGKRVDPWAIDWSQVNPRSIGFRQPPGDRNALGRIKFMFPNSHDVYLHDTPSKSLFGRDVRAFSHGCVRVQEPFEFAQALLAEDGKLTADKLKRLVGGRETRQNLSHHIPVYLTYFTAFVDEAGDLQLRPDIYGHSAKVRTALGLDQSSS